MPRNPPRKTNHGTFSEETIISAVEGVLTGRSIRSVARQEQISFQTLDNDVTRVYNLDKTATVTVQKSSKVLAEKGVNQVNKVTNVEKGVLVTICAIVSAAGNHLRPAIVFPRVHFREHMIAGAPAGTLGLASPSGWMNSELFLKVMEHFILHTSSSKQNPSLLLYDNHESHLSIQVINLAKENGVTIVTYPPNSTNKLQPLDVGIFKSFSLAYNAAIDS
ncbi:uncharacterized protein [Diabrotica undecimpunctata]|uniref:uncharacterized protein n=1 Tax=Diabrotica undecimpunctata TaxID=50387 RepID=UPI003B63D3FC